MAESLWLHPPAKTPYVKALTLAYTIAILLMVAGRPA